MPPPLGSPPIKNQTRSHPHRHKDQFSQSHFRFKDAVVEGAETGDAFVDCAHEDKEGETHSDCEGDVDEACCFDGPVVVGCEGRWDCCEEEVQHAVDYGDVGGENYHNGGAREELLYD